MSQLPDTVQLVVSATRAGLPVIAAFHAVTIGVPSRSGGRLAETIQNLADTVRERLAIAGRAKALAGEAKMSAMIMAALPVVTGGVLAIVEPEQLAPLLFDPRGQHMLDSASPASSSARRPCAS